MSNELLLYGEIGDGDAQAVKSQLSAMDQSDELIVRIDSPGGSVFEGFSIYTALKDYNGPKRCIVESAAFSIASYIAMAFDNIEIADNGYLMIHNPMVSSTGDDEDHRKDAELLAKLKESMVKAYSSRTGKSDDEVRQLMKAETYYNADEARLNGFVSKVLDDSVKSRIVAKRDFMPYRVAASLFSFASNGDTATPRENEPMADDHKPVAATVAEIQAAYPKMSDAFVLNCVKQEKPMASVAAAAAEELLEENEALKASLAAMEEEMASLKSKAMEAEESKAMEEEEEEEAKAKARGNSPVAGVPSASPKSFTEQWKEAIGSELPSKKTRIEAVRAANRKYPGLREKMLEEANA